MYPPYTTFSIDVQIPRGLANSQSYGGNVFSERGLSSRNTFWPFDWLLPNLLVGSVRRGSRSENNLRHITYGKGMHGDALFSQLYFLSLIVNSAQIHVLHGQHL